MKKVLVLALALLTVFAMVGCDSSTDDPGTEPGDDYFVPPADWVGFSDAEYANAIFYIGYTQTGVTSVTKKGSAYEVKIKTLTSNANKQSVVSINFENTVYKNGYYVSLTLPNEGGNARPLNVYAYPIPQGVTDGSGGSVVWSAGMDANTNGEQPKATFDGDYVVGDLKMDWRNADVTAPLTGMSLWFQWDEDVTLANNDKDYIFTINTIKVLPAEGGVEPQPEGIMQVKAYMQETVSWGGTWGNMLDQSPVTNFTINYDSGPLAAPAVYDQFVIDLVFPASAVGKKYQFTVSDVKALDPSGVNTITEAEILAGFRAGNGDNGWTSEPNVVTSAGDAYSVTMTIIADGAGGLTRLIFPRASLAPVGAYGFKAVLSEGYAD
jgi:hypothetical protein